MSEMSSLAQLVSSEPPAAVRPVATPRRNYTDESNPRTRDVDDDAIRRRDQNKADRTAARTDDDRDNGDESRATDDEGSFRSHVRKAMERNQPKADKDGKADNAKPSKTALLQAALATAERVSGEKSAQKTVSLSALTGQATTAEDAPDGVHRAVLAALGQQAKARNAETPETPGGAKAGQLLVKDTGQPAPADATDKSADGKKPVDGKQVADAPKAETPHAANAKGEEVVAQGKSDPAGASAKNIQKEAPTVAGEVAEKTQADQGEGESKISSGLAQPSAAVSGGLQAGQGATGQQTGDGQSRDDGQGRFVLNAAAANPAGRDAATATAPGSDGQTFETTIETVSQASQSASTVGTPTIATAATAAQSAPASASAEGAGEVSPADQVFAQMRGNLRGAGDSMVIRLDPPELGQVRISLEMDADGLRAQIRTDNAQTLGDLQREAQTLINRLTEAGIQVRRVDIQPTEQSGERPMHDPADGQAQQNANPQEAQDHSGGARGRDGEADAGDNDRQPASAGETTNEPQDQPDASPTGEADGSINVMM